MKNDFIIQCKLEKYHQKILLKRGDFEINQSITLKLEFEKKNFSREECQAYAYKTNATCKAKIKRRLVFYSHAFHHDLKDHGDIKSKHLFEATHFEKQELDFVFLTRCVT